MRTGFTITLTDGTIFNSVTENIVMANKPDIALPQLLTDTQNVIGRNSSLTYNYNCYQDRAITLNLAAKKYSSFANLKKVVAKGMAGTIQFNYLNYYFKFKAGISYVNRDAKGIPEVDVELVIEPFGYLPPVTIITTEDFNVGNEVDTPCRIYLYGKGSFWLNGTQIQITEDLVVDTETLQVYAVDDVNNPKGTSCVCNLLKVKIKPGTNKIRKDSTITNFAIHFNPVIFE